MKNFSLFVLSLLCAQNFNVYAMEHGIVFEDQESITKSHPYLKDINLNMLPVFEDEKLIEVNKKELSDYHLIVENEYAVNDSIQDKKLATVGIYDCIGLVIPTVNKMVHIHQKTNLETVGEIIREHSKEKVFLYTCSINPYIEKVLEILNKSGFENKLVTLSVRPVAIEELGTNSIMKYSYSYDDTLKNLPKAYMPQKMSFYVRENEEKTVKECYAKHRQSQVHTFQKAVGFMTDVRSPLHIALEDQTVSLFKIDYKLMRKEQENISNFRNSLSKNHIVHINFD